MTLQEFFKHDIFKLPIVWKGKYTSYLKAVKNIGEMYIDLVNQIYQSEFEHNGNPIENCTKEELLKLTQNVLVAVVKCLKIYLVEGHPTKAYRSLSNSFTVEGKINKKEAPTFSLQFDKLYPKCYRVRKSTENLNHVSEMFHVPFDKRHLIRSNRYSIPGFPTLYLANSVYVAYMELGELDFDNVYISKFIHRSGVQWSEYPDLFNLRNEYTSSRDLFIARWPLIMACSLKTAYPESDFKPEYILPQIILQWTKDRVSIGGNKRRVIGVTYSSSKIPIHKNGYIGEFYNIAIPVERAYEHGYCPKLTSLFELTKPISFSEGLNSKIEAEQHDYIESIHDLWNNKFEYTKTGFAKVETFLNQLPCEILNRVEQH
ncbi:MAG: hypothetical protein JJU28_20765 [Cyclobacteriaceae bacterium]|nr:hypothetical protein [Cyclobacteriaceae bacterium]